MNTDTATLRLSRFSRVAILSSLFSLVLTAGQISFAQEAESKSPLTVEYLIGDAVSLSNESYPEIEKAIQRFTNRDVIGAQEYLEKAVEKHKKLPPADILLAKMQVLARNNRAVLFLLDRTATDHPEDPEAFLMLADLALQAQRNTEAMVLFNHAAPLVEKFSGNSKRKRKFNVRLLGGRAAIAERRSDWETADKLLTEWISIDPRNALAHTRKGIVMFRLEKYKEALAEFTKGREINADAAHPYVSLGRLFTSNDDLKKARQSYERAYNEDKSDVKVAQAFAEWLIQQDELDQAEQIAASLRKQSPDSQSALFLDGIVAYMQNDSKRAEQALQKVLSLEPRNARATDLLALLLIKSDSMADKERALQYAQLNSERFAKSAQANVTRAWVLYELGRKAEAQKSLQQAGKMKIQPDSTYLIAKILAAEGQNERAIQALEQIIAQKNGLIIFRREAEALLKQLQGSEASSE